MKNIVFNSAKERKNDFMVVVEYIQWGKTTHTIKKSSLNGKKVLGMNSWTIENPNFQTPEQFQNSITKTKSNLLPFITKTEWVFDLEK